MGTFLEWRDCYGMPEEGEEKNGCAEQDQAPIADITAGQAQQGKHHWNTNDYHYVRIMEGKNDPQI